MSYMFSGCSGLTTLDVSTFNTSKSHHMYYMFSGCNNLIYIYMCQINGQQKNQILQICLLVVDVHPLLINKTIYEKPRISRLFYYNNRQKSHIVVY